jgi:hypothetical protein
LTVTLAVAVPLPPAPVQDRTKLAAPIAVGVTLAVPLVASDPLQPLLAVQAVAPVELQVSVIA